MTEKKENPILVELSRKNREFWRDINSRVSKRMKNLGEVEVAIGCILEKIHRGSVEVPTFEEKMLEYEHLEAAEQSRRAKAKRKPARDRPDAFDELLAEGLMTKATATANDLWEWMVQRIESDRAGAAMSVEDKGEAICVERQSQTPRRIKRTSFSAVLSKFRKSRLTATGSD